jgi:hypothetical protein
MNLVVLWLLFAALFCLYDAEEFMSALPLMNAVILGGFAILTVLYMAVEWAAWRHDDE